MTPYSIYVVDDEAVARNGLKLALEKKNYDVQAFESAESGLEAIDENPPDLVLLDIGLPGMSGVEALEIIKARHPEVIIVMITAYEDVPTVVSSMRNGAYEYVVKPVQMDSLLVILRNAFETISMRKEIQALHEKYLKENLPCFIGESNAIQDVMELVAKVAQSPTTPILILGDTGTGKELIAKAIHYKSPNFKGPMVAVNCAAMPRELIESELFGYEKGAFTGAERSGKEGLVEKAANGTLFLDEVADLSTEAQVKLLRFLDEGEYYRIGGTRKRTVKTRIISATNRDLAGAQVELLNEIGRELRLKKALIPVQADYDTIFIDCPPALNVLTINAMVASNSVMIPMQCEYFALEGLSALIATVRKIRETLNPGLSIEGLLRTMFDGRNSLSNEVSRQLQSHFGNKVYQTLIPRNVRLAEAPSYGEPAIIYDPSSKGAQAYLALADEFLQQQAAKAAASSVN